MIPGSTPSSADVHQARAARRGAQRARGVAPTTTSPKPSAAPRSRRKPGRGTGRAYVVAPSTKLRGRAVVLRRFRRQPSWKEVAGRWRPGASSIEARNLPPCVDARGGRRLCHRRPAKTSLTWRAGFRVADVRPSHRRQRALALRPLAVPPRHQAGQRSARAADHRSTSAPCRRLQSGSAVIGDSTWRQRRPAGGMRIRRGSEPGTYEASPSTISCRPCGHRPLGRMTSAACCARGFLGPRTRRRQASAVRGIHPPLRPPCRSLDPRAGQSRRAPPLNHIDARGVIDRPATGAARRATSISGANGLPPRARYSCSASRSPSSTCASPWNSSPAVLTLLGRRELREAARGVLGAQTLVEYTPRRAGRVAHRRRPVARGETPRSVAPRLGSRVDSPRRVVELRAGLDERQRAAGHRMLVTADAPGRRGRCPRRRGACSAAGSTPGPGAAGLSSKTTPAAARARRHRRRRRGAGGVLKQSSLSAACRDRAVARRATSIGAHRAPPPRSPTSWYLESGDLLPRDAPWRFRVARKIRPGVFSHCRHNRKRRDVGR